MLDRTSVGMYTTVYICTGVDVDTAKLFKNGRSQAVRLPKEYALPGDEVYVKKVDGIVMLIPKESDPWGPFIDGLDKFSDDFMCFKCDQGTFEQRGIIR